MRDNITLPSLDIPTIETPFLSNDSIIALDIDTKNRYDKVFSGGSNPMPYPMPNYQAGTGYPSQQQVLNNSFSRGTLGQALVSPNKKVRDMASDFVNYKTSYNNPARYNIGVPKVIQYDPAMDKYINGKFGYNPDLGIEGNEQLYYQDYLSKNIFSRSLSNIGTFFGRFGTGVAAKTVGTFGYLGSMIGNGIEELFNSEGNNAMADIANNSLSRWAEVNWEENWKNSAALAVFKPSDWEHKGFWSKLGNAAFWTDEVADGAAFMGEMILSTYLTGGLGKVAGLSKFGATGINTASRLSKFGKFAGGAGKVIDWTTKFATGADDIAGIGRWAFLTTSESAVESAGKYRVAKDDMMRKRDQGHPGFANMTDFQIENEASNIAAASFKGNMMVLAASNAFENRFIFNKIFGTKKLDDVDNAVFGKARAKNISIATGGKTLDDIGKASMKDFKYTTKLGKYFDWKNGLSRSRFYGWMGLRAMGAEGLWEENAQLAIERLSNDEHYRRMNPIRQFLGIVGTSEKQAFDAFAGEDVEASTAIGLGTIIGLGGGAVVSKAFGGSKDGKLKFFKGERKQILEDTQNLITRYEDARGKMFSFNKIWKRDENGKFVRDQDGNLEIDEAAAASVLQSLGRSMDHLSRIDEIQNPTLRQKMMDDLMVDFVFAAKKAGIFERSIESINRIKDYTEDEAVELGFDPSSMADHKKVIDGLNLTGKLYDQVYNNTRNKTYTNNDDLIDEENRKYSSFKEKAQIESIKRTIENLTAEEQEFVIQNLDFTNPERSRSDIREINTLRLQLYRLEEFEKEALSPLMNDLFSEHIKAQKEKIKKELDRLEPLYKEDIKDKKLENIRPEGSPIDILYTTEQLDDWRLDNLYFKGLIDSMSSVGSLRNALAQSEFLDSFIDVTNEKSLENYRKLKALRDEVNGLTNLTFLEERIAMIKKSIEDLKSKAVLTDAEKKELAGYEEQLKKLEELYTKAVEKRNKEEEEAGKGDKTESATEPTKEETEEEKVAREAKEKEQEDKEEENIKAIVNLLSTMSTDDKEEDVLKKEEDLKKLFGNIKNYELTISRIKELLDKGINENQINAIVNAIDDLSLEDEFNDLLLYINTKEEEREQKEGEEEQPEEKEIVVTDEIDNLEKENTKPPEEAPVVTETPTAPVSVIEAKKADIERRRQEELATIISLISTAENRRPNGSIGTQGFDPTQMRDLIKFLNEKLSLNIDEKLFEGEKLKPLIDFIKDNEELVEKIKQYVKTNPIEVSTMPDGSLSFRDGNHRANLLNLIGSDILPTIEVGQRSKIDEINAKYDAELNALEEATSTIPSEKKFEDLKRGDYFIFQLDEYQVEAVDRDQKTGEPISIEARNQYTGDLTTITKEEYEDEVGPIEEKSIIGEKVGDFIIREEDGKWKVYNKDGDSLGLSYNTKEEAINEINKTERTKKVYDSQLDDNIQELKSATKEERNEILETIARDINRVVEVDGKLQYDPNATDAADRIAAIYHPKIIKLANDTFPKYKKIVEEYEKELIRKQNEPISDDVFEQFRNGDIDPTILQSIAKKDLENPDSLSDREKIIRDAKQKQIADIKKVLLNQDDTRIVPRENTAADYQKQENFVDKHSDKRKAEGQFTFISTGPQEVIMKDDKPVIVDNVVQTQAGTGTEKEKYRRYRNVIEKHGNDFRPEANKKFRLKLLTVNDNNRPWFIATSTSTSIIAVITDSQGRIISFDEQGNINPKGTPLAFEFSMAEYSSRTDKTGTPNILLKRSSIILGGNEKVEGEPGTRPFFDELWEKKTNEATINNTSEIDFDPTGDIVNLLKSGVEIFADFDTVLNSKLSSSRVNNRYSVKGDENFETEAKTLQELMDLGFLDENAFPVIETTSIRYFEDSAGQNVKVGAPYFPAPESKLKIPLFGKKIKDLTIGGNRIYSSETGELYSFGRVIQFIQDNKFVVKNDKTTDKVYRIPRSEFLQRSGTEAQSIFREITDEEFEKIYNYLNDLFYSEDIEFAIENEELIVRDKRPVKIPLSEYRINMNDVDFNVESREFIFNDERFGEEYTYSYLSFVKENFISNSLPANIGEQNGKPVINFAKLNRRVIFTLEYSYPEIEAKLKNINVKPEATPQKADPQTEETIKKSSDIASENKNGFGSSTDNITFEC